MIILDVNVVLAAFRADHSHHEVVRPWFDEMLVEESSIAAPDLVWVDFVRLCTNARIFAVPASLEQASEFVRATTAQPAYVSISGLRDGIGPFLDLAIASSATANLTTDAYIAAIALAWAAPVATLDRDFRRFDGLRILDPAVGRRRDGWPPKR